MLISGFLSSLYLSSKLFLVDYSQNWRLSLDVFFSGGTIYRCLSLKSLELFWIKQKKLPWKTPDSSICKFPNLGLCKLSIESQILI